MSKTLSTSAIRAYSISAGALAVFGTLLLAAPQQAQAEKYRYVNVQQILENSKAGREAADRTRDLREEITDDLRPKGEELQEKRNSLIRRRDVMTETAFERESQELVRETNELREEAQRLDRDAQERIRANYQQIENQLQDIMTEMMEDRNLDGILNRTSYLVAPPEHDITSEVLAEIDRRLPRLR